MQENNTEEIMKIYKETLQILKKVNAYDTVIFKKETNYLGSLYNSPITRDCEYYINGSEDKKKGVVNSKDRMFSRNYPHSKDFN